LASATVRTKGALSAKTAKLMVFKLVNAAAKTWRRLKGENQLPVEARALRRREKYRAYLLGNLFAFDINSPVDARPTVESSPAEVGH
jgi:hypothetical protein